MQEILRNTQENDTFFYIFIGILVILSGFVKLFKKNLSRLYNKRARVTVRNESLFIMSGIILVSLSIGFFLSTIAQWFYFSTALKIHSTLCRAAFYSALGYLFIFCYFLWNRMVFFMMRSEFEFIFYHLIHLRFMLPVGSILLIATPVIYYFDFSIHLRDIIVLSIFIIIVLLTIIGIIERMIYLIKQTNIPSYYIILYLCALELLPLLILGKIIIEIKRRT